MKDLHELVEIVDGCLLNDKTIDSVLTQSIKQYTKNGGYVGIAQINPIAGNIEYIQQKPLGRLLISLRGNDKAQFDSVLTFLKEKAYVHEFKGVVANV